MIYLKYMSNDRPYFLWDYQITEQGVRDILNGSDVAAKTLLITRIVESARYDDVWKYITPAELVRVFPQLTLKKPVRKAWEYAFSVWGLQTN